MNMKSTEIIINVPHFYRINRSETGTILEIVVNGFCIPSKFLGTTATDEQVRQWYQQKANSLH